MSRLSMPTVDNAPSHWLDSYPGHLSRTWTLSMGQSLLVRPVHHDDGELGETSVFPTNFIARRWIDSAPRISAQQEVSGR